MAVTTAVNDVVDRAAHPPIEKPESPATPLAVKPALGDVGSVAAGIEALPEQKSRAGTEAEEGRSERGIQGVMLLEAEVEGGEDESDSSLSILTCSTADEDYGSEEGSPSPGDARPKRGQKRRNRSPLPEFSDLAPEARKPRTTRTRA